MTDHCTRCGLVTLDNCHNDRMANSCPNAPGAAFYEGALAGLKKWHYSTILADPPWSYKTYSNREQGTVPHRTETAPYQSMTLDELLALPVQDLATKDAVLHLWTISSHFDQALELGEAWGFTYKSLGLIWVKTQKGDPETPKMGMGKWFRQEGEVCLLFTRGKPSRVSAGVRQVILEPAREHSRKPDESLARVEALTAGPYLELFSRSSRPGWDAMGDQKGRFDPLDPKDEATILEMV